MKKSRLQFLSNTASTSSFIPRHSGDLGNRFGSAKWTDTGEACELTKHRGSTHRGHDFGRVRVMSGSPGAASAANDQTPDKSSDPDEKPTTSGTTVPAAEKDIDLGEERNKPVGMPVVDRVDLVTSSTGAVGGFPAIDCLADLNSPGPYNDQAFRGSVANVHQIQFHLSQGYPGDLRATRIVNRTAVGAGKNFPKAGNDGPPDHEFIYTKDKMVIADAPGWCQTLKDSDFPVNYKADFAIYAWDAPTRSILASMSYRVEVDKTYYSQPAPVNTVTITGLKIGGAVKSPVKPVKPKK